MVWSLIFDLGMFMKEMRHGPSTDRPCSPFWNIRGSAAARSVSLVVGVLALVSTSSETWAAVTSTNASSTIAASNTWQQLLAASGGTGRIACQLQNPLYDAIGNINTSVLFVVVGTAFGALNGMGVWPSRATSFQLAPGGSYNCADGSGVEQAVLSISGGTMGQPFIFTWQ